MTVSTITRALQAVGLSLALIFCWFVPSGLPGFYDPYKLDGKGVDPQKYLCEGFRRGPAQCDAAEYWMRIFPIAAIKTVAITIVPLVLPAERRYLVIYALPVGIFFVLQYRAKIKQ